MAARRRLRLASTSSETSVKIWSDQPRITVWPRSTTTERPLRSCSSCRLSPLVSRPTRALTTKMPPSASTNHSASTARVSCSGTERLNVLMNVRQSSWKKLGPWPAASTGTTKARASVTVTMSATDAIASQPMRLGVPRDIVLSNQYRSRVLSRAFRAIRRISPRHNASSPGDGHESTPSVPPSEVSL